MRALPLKRLCAVGKNAAELLSSTTSSREVSYQRSISQVISGFAYQMKKKAGYHDVKSDGKCDWRLGRAVNHVVLGPNKPTLNLDGYCLIFTESSVLPEEAFQKIVAYMREAGELYRKVRIASEWSGVEEVIL